jgi:CBS-domain-containing membrane protein
MSDWVSSDRGRDRTVATLRLLLPLPDVDDLLLLLFLPPLEAFAVAFFAIAQSPLPAQCIGRANVSSAAPSVSTHITLQHRTGERDTARR